MRVYCLKVGGRRGRVKVENRVFVNEILLPDDAHMADGASQQYAEQDDDAGGKKQYLIKTRYRLRLILILPHFYVNKR